MLTIFIIFWNNTGLIVLHEFKISGGKTSYDYIIRILAYIFVLLFFFLILVVSLVEFYIVLDEIKAIEVRTILPLCILFPFMCSALGLWYVYVLIAIRNIKRNYQLWRKTGSMTRDIANMKKMVFKIGVWSTVTMAVVCLALMLICNQIVVNNAEGKAYSDIDSIKYNKVGLLLGTTPQARITKVKNYFFIYRLDAAEQLYRAGKIEKILISGDEHSLDGVNEPECMRDSLVARGIPASAIILDGKGYRTINSIINANKVFGLKSFTIISQEFHNERAIYQAEHLGLDVENLQAYNAKMPKSRRAYITTIREYFARVKMFWDLITY